jgi:DNA-binding NarL/FixJ family response regulator
VPVVSNCPDPIRVLLADDDAGFRTALREWLELDARFVVVAESSTGSGLRELVALTDAEVVVLDVRMPGGGAAAAAALSGHEPWGELEALPARRPVVVGLSAHSNAATVAAMVAAGATGFLAKGTAVDALPDLLARCAAGEVVLAVPTAAEALRQVPETRYAVGGDWTPDSRVG